MITYEALQNFLTQIGQYPIFWVIVGAAGFWLFWLPWHDHVAGGYIFQQKNMIVIPIIIGLAAVIVLVVPALSWELAGGLVLIIVSILVAKFVYNHFWKK